MHSSSAVASLRAAIPRCTATAQATASTTLGKFDQDAVTRGLDDAPLVLGDLRVDQIAAQRPEARKRAGLVPFHQTAVSGDIGCQNGREPALDPLCAQGALPGGDLLEAGPPVGL
jgi:hypothetical protein